MFIKKSEYEELRKEIAKLNWKLEDREALINNIRKEIEGTKFKEECVYYDIKRYVHYDIDFIIIYEYKNGVHRMIDEFELNDYNLEIIKKSKIKNKLELILENLKTD